MNTGIVVVLLSLGVVCAVLGLLLLSLRRDNARLFFKFINCHDS